jgi:branched-subunit amino acid ABC-type transport system permease component
MYLVNYTKLGRAMRATAENPRVAGADGREARHGDLGHLHHRRHCWPPSPA